MQICVSRMLRESGMPMRYLTRISTDDGFSGIFFAVRRAFIMNRSNPYTRLSSFPSLVSAFCKASMLSTLQTGHPISLSR